MFGRSRHNNALAPIVTRTLRAWTKQKVVIYIHFNKYFESRCGPSKDLHSEEMGWKQRKNLLKEHELGELAKRPGGATIGGKAMQVSDVKDIVPVSDELRALMPELAKAEAQRRNK